MLAFHLTRNAATATILVAALAVGALCDGKAKAQSAPAPARVFTINEILAKQDSGRPGTTGKVAAVERHGALSDAVPETHRARGPEPFGMFALKAPEGNLWNKWRGIQADIARESKKVEACRNGEKCAAEAKQYLAIVAEIKARTGRVRLETANRLMNGAIRYASDQQQHGTPDRWSAPLVSLAAGQGDCEDFATAKYVALRDAGVDESDMRLVLVRDTHIRIDHAVLAVRQNGEWLVLDNRRSFVAEPGELKHYTPLFALDHEGVKLFAEAYASWGESTGGFAEWNLRGGDGIEFSEWALRASNAEPAATE